MNQFFGYSVFLYKKNIMPKEIKTQRQLAKEYGICRNTFRAWIKPIEKELKLTRKNLRPWQVKMIYDFLEKP